MGSRGISDTDSRSIARSALRLLTEYLAEHRGIGEPQEVTEPAYIATMQYTKATLLVRTREILDDGSIVEIVVWELPEPLPPSGHHFKYRLFYGVAGICRIRYDNERGKGDHRHIGDDEQDYSFTSVDQLFDDFERDIANWS